ncbi:MAG: amino acid ABC transporter substrate-binding protein [Clostridia bacterium]|nr:amino acid ABC transporter substrate-binding protein [Clostridia bacterium]
MKKTVFGLIPALLASLLLFAAVGCSPVPKNEQKDDSLTKVLGSGELVLGLDVEFPPMGFEDENGEIVGFDVDVAREVCRRLGVTLTLRPIDWDEKEDDLNEGRIDCIWNGFSVTPARAEAMLMSYPYMKNELIVVVPGDSDVKVLRGLAGKRVGVQSGSTAQEVLESSEIFGEITPVLYDTATILLDKLDGGEIDAALVDSVAAYYLIFSSEHGRYFVLSDSLGEEEYAIGFRKDDRALCDRIEEIISEMKADGTLGDISKKWFGSDITTVK